VRGALIAPGSTFSVNDYVGQRTAAKGFVSAGVIEDGEFKEDFGGGVSQFATTLFNAAFFGGYEIPDYKAHSVYISRYPFGREATLAYPNVDLKIHNDSPFGVVIWPTYTDSSVTVTLYSSRWAVGEVVSGPTAAERSPQVPEGCGRVKTVRKVTKIASGEPSRDSFYAYYTCDPPEH
jgi:vancomycin resistance protein YoaR